MKKYMLLIILFIFIVGCSTDDTENSKNKSKESASSTEEKKQDKVKEDEANDEKNQKTDEEKEGEGANELSEEMDKLLNSGETTIPKEEIDSPFGEDGNIINEHTEQEIVEEHMDEDGRIYFDLDDQPVRSIVNEDKSITNITNYNDAYINLNKDVAYVIPEESIDFVYDFFIANQPDDLKELNPDDYRSWDEATNLERGIMQMTILISPTLNEMDHLIAEEKYDGKEMESIQEEFFELGSPNVLIPAPQTALDIQLFENMQMIKLLWEEVGKFEHTDDNHDEFAVLNQELRQEMNNLLVRINFTLSEDVMN